MERISCYLRHSLQGNVLIASSHNIHLYSASSSGNKMSLIDCPVFKQQNTIWASDTHRKNDSLTRKFIKNHHMVMTSLVKHTLPIPHLETYRIYLPLHSPLARDVIYGWPLSRVFLKYRFYVSEFQLFWKKRC